MESGGSMSIPVPSLIGSSPSGGRFQFDDGGSYCGGWQDGKAHGHGVCTGPKNVGEYSGSWNFGFEMSGVYKWKNGAVYEGRWQNGKRHGVGVEYNGKWGYKGEWSQGFKGRYGVKASLNSAVKYEGTWANGLQDGYGSETYSDGGYYQGQMCRGLRHGYGVRKSAAYGESQLNNPGRLASSSTATSGAAGALASGGSAPLVHSNSLQSSSSMDGGAGVGDGNADDSPKPEDGFKPNIERTVASKNGFVLVAHPLEVPLNSSGGGRSSEMRRGSLGGRIAGARLPGKPVSLLKRGLRLRKQKSSSDLEQLASSSSAGKSSSKQPGYSGSGRGGNSPEDTPLALPFTLSPEELDITDPSTVETYTGEWKHDKRNGYGVCERSDGLRYEGQWHNDMKCGFGQTTFKDSSKEEGKYKNNILIADSKLKRLFQLAASTNIRQRIDESVKMAQQAQQVALKKAEIADTRAATARDKAEQATIAALEADRDSQIAFSVARQYSESQQQLGTAFAGSGYSTGAPMSGFAGQRLGQNSMLLQIAPGNSGNSSILNSSAVSPQAALQARRVSQYQQQQQQQLTGNYGNYPSQLSNQNEQNHDMNANHTLDNLNQQQFAMHDGQQQQYLSGLSVEPFNGRRGSFRGLSGSRALPAAHSLTYGSSPTSGSSANFRQTSSDPFSDLFDHYRSTPQQHSARQHPMLSKQSSLDYQRPSSGEPGGYPSRSANLRKLRMNVSMDQANPPTDEIDRVEFQRQQQYVADQVGQLDMQQQLRHLVTSGEDLQRTNKYAANSSYPLPTSTSSAGSSFYPGQTTKTPSPEGWSAANQQQQQTINYYPSRPYVPPGMLGSQQGKQRDVHSLADEQLYSANRRQMFQLEDQTEFVNYDFAISSSPRPAKRCIRRTASLSRNTLTSQELRASSQLLSTSKGIIQQQRSASPHFSITNASPTSIDQQPNNNNNNNNNNNQLQQQQVSLQSATLGTLSNELQAGQPLPTGSNSSHLTLDSSVSSTSVLFRKPSLQVRYDPIQLGGLMTREEVAALSHAQREQKRLELELAELRAKRPLLHLYLSVKEFLIRQQLLITVLVINAFVFKMFADLIL